MPENFAVIYVKIETKRPNLREFHQKGANGVLNSEDPDQTAPLGAVCLGLHCLPRLICPKTLDHYHVEIKVNM